MKQYVVEKEFESNGLKCVVVMQLMGHRCGYVGIPKNHPLYRKDESSFRKILGDEDCHGGITFTGGSKNSSYPIQSDLWWFGFDCDHACDSNDYESAKQLFADDTDALERIKFYEKDDINFSHSRIRSLEYVENECCKLAYQLSHLREEEEVV